MTKYVTLKYRRSEETCATCTALTDYRKIRKYACEKHPVYHRTMKEAAKHGCEEYERRLTDAPDVCYT